MSRQSRNPIFTLIWISVLTAVCVVIALPKELPIRFSLGPVQINKILVRPNVDLRGIGIPFQRDLNLKMGLDIQGGTRIVMQADMSGVKAEDRQTALESAQSVVARRVDLYGVSESTVRTSRSGDEYRVVVELPGITDAQQAVDLIGTTAQLDFREEDLSIPVATQPASLREYFGQFKPTNLSGKDLSRSLVEFDSNTGKPAVRLDFTSEGSKKFAEITKRAVKKRVGIFLDDMPITTPVVNEPITQGTAQISGSFTLEEAKKLSVQLNAGALPIPLQVVQQETVEASLGEDAVRRTFLAGLIGVGLVALFMILYYGVKGLLAVFALLIYAVITVAIYKLIPITLTLPGVAGLLLSIGMAVDSNILIFERMKEELRWGRPFKQAMELAFGRAWDSIKDANVATLFTSFILFNPLEFEFLNRSGMVRGFALTLAMGIAVGLFTGIVVTRTLLRIFLAEPNQVSPQQASKEKEGNGGKYA